MKDWFASLEPRERMIFVAGSVAAVLIVAWMFLVKPLRDQAGVLRASVAANQELLIGLGRVEGIQQSGARPGTEGAQLSLVVLIDRTAQERGLSLPRSRPEGADGINVTVQNASFDTLMEWLIFLDAAHSVTVEAASIAGAREQGLVNGTLSLRRL